MATEGYSAEFSDDEEIWHISRGNNRSGPFRFSDLVEAVDLQLLKATDFIWHHKWGDWRQVKSVPCLASRPILSDCEQLAKSAIPISALVQKVDVTPRQSPLRKSVFRPFWRGKNIVYFTCLLLISFAIVSLIGLSTLVFGNSRHGAAYISAEFVTLVLLGILITQNSTKSGHRILRACSLFAVAALLLVVMNVDRLPDAFDVWQAKTLLAHARTPEQIRRVALDHPSNRFVELVLASNDAAQESAAATAQLLQELEPQGITLDTLRAAPSREQLVENARDLRAAAARAEFGMTRYLAILDSERAQVDKMGQKIYSRDPLRVLPDFMAAFGRREDALRERMKKTFMAIETFYSLKGDVAEFLVRNWDVTRPRTAFPDQATSDKYHKLASMVRTAQAGMLELERGNQKLKAERRTLWSQQIGAGQ